MYVCVCICRCSCMYVYVYVHVYVYVCIYIYINSFFLMLSSVIVYPKRLDVVPCAMQ